MNAPNRLAGLRTMSSREFNQHTSRAKAAADKAPLVITDRGSPAYVLLSKAHYERLARTPSLSALESLADPYAKDDDFDLMDFIPPRTVDPVRFEFDEDE